MCLRITFEGAVIKGSQHSFDRFFGLGDPGLPRFFGGFLL